MSKIFLSVIVHIRRFVAWVNHLESYSILIKILWGSSENLSFFATVTSWHKNFIFKWRCFAAIKLPVFQPHLGQKLTFTFSALVTLENLLSYQKLFLSLVKWQMNEVKYCYLPYCRGGHRADWWYNLIITSDNYLFKTKRYME